MHANSESDVTSLAALSPPRSPKRGGGGTATGNGNTTCRGCRGSQRTTAAAGRLQLLLDASHPMYAIPNESPSRPSYDRQSWASSVSRFSGILHGHSVHKLHGLKADNIIEEEGSYEGLEGCDIRLSGRCKILLGFLTFVLLFDFRPK